jgi:hypothetical protein
VEQLHAPSVPRPLRRQFDADCGQTSLVRGCQRDAGAAKGRRQFCSAGAVAQEGGDEAGSVCAQASAPGRLPARKHVGHAPLCGAGAGDVEAAGPGKAEQMGEALE